MITWRMTGADSPRGLADVAVVDRARRATTIGPLALGGDRLLDQLLDARPALGVTRQVAHADAVAPGGGQLDRPATAPRMNASGIWMQDPGAVAGVGVRALGAAVLHVLQRLERLLDHGVARLAPQLRHQGDAAGIVLVGLGRRGRMAPGSAVR